MSNTKPRRVSPLAGEWIEILLAILNAFIVAVSPLAGEWIEMHEADNILKLVIVSPLAGEWIEIGRQRSRQQAPRSRPSRASGLKSCAAGSKI